MKPYFASAASGSWRFAGHGWSLSRPVLAAAVVMSLSLCSGPAAEATRLHNDVAATNTPSANPYHNFISFVTNCPPIAHLALTMAAVGQKEKHYIFRFNEGGFFARESCEDAEHLDTECDQDTMCGRWGNTYWYYDPGGRKATLYTYTNTPASTMGHTKFFRFFGQYQSFGLSDAGPNSVRFNGREFSWPNEDGVSTDRGVVKLTNGVPWQASMTKGLSGGRTVDLQVDYHYLPAVTPSGIPTEIVTSQQGHAVFRIAVRRMESGSPEQLMPESLFLPPLAVAQATNLARVLVTNAAHYYVEHGTNLFPMDVDYAGIDAAKRKAAQRSLIIGVSVLALLLTPLWLALSKRRSKRTNT